MDYKDTIDIAESLRRQARKAVNKFQTELDSDVGLVDAMKNFGESAIYGKLMLEHLEGLFNILDSNDDKEAEPFLTQYLMERNEFLTGMKPWVPNSTDVMNNLVNSVSANVLADLIEAFKE
ncbi:hypothetical protein A9Q99_12285 [Gammaproteobacteria bacterium 45_16_T64]|nr:hypothetical protein A9Q99_12285 [Gammaproteobacteria bacterium 45_16_T64]